MIKSMTAYGKSELERDGIQVTVEIRSVNHRYRDVSLRTPYEINYMEPELRSVLFQSVSRGRIDLSVSIDMSDTECSYDIELNTPVVESYIRIFAQIEESFGIKNDVGVDSLCKLKNVLVMKPKVLDDELVHSLVLEALNQAIVSFDNMKRTEGKAIETDFVKRLKIIDQLVDKIVDMAPKVVEEYRNRLYNNLKQLLKDTPVDVDDNRFIYEVSIFSERCDITEELVRIKSHIRQFLSFLEEESPVGRRLDFLLQEMNREVNTIGSKANDAEISRTVVDIKGELEKLREQVQNIE